MTRVRCSKSANMLVCSGKLHVFVNCYKLRDFSCFQNNIFSCISDDIHILSFIYHYLFILISFWYYTNALVTIMGLW